MKKLTFIVAFITFLCANSGISQTGKGTFLLGSLNYNTGYNGDFNLFFDPHLGYFVADNVVVGSNFAFLSQFDDDGTVYVNSIGPYVRGYFAGNDWGKFFAQAKTYLLFAKGYSGEIFQGWELNAGYSFFVFKNIGMEYSIQYNKMKDYNGILSLNVGFNFHLFKSE